MKNKTSFLNKQMPIPLFLGLAFVIGVLFTIIQSFFCYDTDMYFMIETGNKIRELGFFDHQLWTIDRPGGFVAQQWLWDVLLSVMYDIGLWTYPIISFLQVSLFIIVVYKFLRGRSVSVMLSAIAAFAMSLISGTYVFSIRPECMSMILILLDCYALDRFRETKHYRWLIMLPVVMLIEANVHISMWFMHFAMLFAYTVPSFYCKSLKQDHLFSHWKAICLTALGMFAAMFVNPYGVNGVSYVIKAMTSNTFTFVKVVEMQPTCFLTANGFIILGLFAFALFLQRRSALRSTSANMVIGICFLMMIALRSIIFASIATVFILSDAYCLAQQKEIIINWKKDVKWRFFLIAMPAIGFLLYSVCGMGSTAADLSIAESTLIARELTPIVEYFDEQHVDKHVHIFTCDTSGAYFELMGYDNIYFDARPETFAKSITGDKDIIGDFYKYATAGVELDIPGFPMKYFVPEKRTLVDQSDMEKWLSEYDFEYIVLTETSMYLHGYVDASDSYEKVELDTEMFSLYKKVDK